jgi:type III pantothenate kinase
MRTLLVDVGNSRVKWATWDGRRLGVQRAMSLERAAGRGFAAFVARLPRDWTAARVVSVAAPAQTRALLRALRQRASRQAVLVRTKRFAAGVTCAYREPWRLGTDRWVAAIAGHHLARLRGRTRPVCVVDVGTALTVDLVDRTGVHRGGAIVPGPDLMTASLLGRTGGIRARAARRSRVGRGVFARDTRAAVIAGTRHAAAAFVDHAYDAARAATRERPLLLLTGGAAPDIAPHLHRAHRLVPDLVLRGLVLLG